MIAVCAVMLLTVSRQRDTGAEAPCGSCADSALEGRSSTAVRACDFFEDGRPFAEPLNEKAAARKRSSNV